MRVLIAVLALVAMFFIGAKMAMRLSDPDPDNSKVLHQMAYQPIPARAPEPKVIELPHLPQFGWVLRDNETFDLNLGQGKSWSALNGSKYKFAVDATQATSFGMGTPEEIAAATSNGFDPSALFCSATGVISREQVCDIPEGSSFVLFDGRTTGQIAGNGIAAILTRNRNASERLISPNRVTVRVYEWKCVNFCSAT